jgi:perosamine synthetase
MKAAPSIPIAKPFLGEEEIVAIRRVIDSGWVTQGPEVLAFEEDFSRFVNSKYACAVSSGTSALHLALLALGVGQGDEVITVSHSFIATANAIRYCGATPVFIDIDPGTFNINPGLIERAISPKTRAILSVHQMGMPADMNVILGIAQKRNLPVIEDAACAIGSELLWQGNWEKIGKPHGIIACFSFHPRKLLTTGDGGMLTTADPILDKKFRLLRQHGMDLPDLARHTSKEVSFERYPILGFNYRMTDVQASMGRVQLKRLNDQIPRRRKLADSYNKAFKNIPELKCPIEPKWAQTNWQSYCLGLSAKVSQKEIMQFLLDRGIATRRGIMCAHAEESYRGQFRSCHPTQNCACPVGECSALVESKRAQSSSLLLPLFYDLKESEQEKVIEEILDFIIQKL